MKLVSFSRNVSSPMVTVLTNSEFRFGLFDKKIVSATNSEFSTVIVPLDDTPVSNAALYKMIFKCLSKFATFVPLFVEDTTDPRDSFLLIDHFEHNMKHLNHYFVI